MPDGTDINNAFVIFSTPKLRAFVKELKQEKYLKRHPEVPIYHYTNAKGLLGIVKNKTFWCTHIEYMSDAEELSYSEELFIERVNEIKKECSTDELFFEILENESFVASRKGYDIYVTCFSEKKDNLSQWREYGSYCIGFDTNNPFRTDTHANYASFSSSWQPARLRKVVYSRDKQIEIADKIIEAVYDAFKSYLESKTTEHSYKTVAKWFADSLTSLAFEYIISFKNDIFEEEQEWRLIHLGIKNSGVKFRTKDDMVIPYKESGIRIFDESKNKGIYRKEYEESEMARNNFGDFDDFMRDRGQFGSVN